MQTNCVLLPPINEEDMALQESDLAILEAAQRYITLKQKEPALLELTEDRLLSGTPGTVYLKKLGHRPLTSADFENIVKAYGTDEDKRALTDFTQAKAELQERLNNTRSIGLVLEQAELTKNEFYYRVKQSDRWKPEEIVKVMEVLDRLRI
ncbi:MAG: hypothetical protein EOO61_04320 [Hymenobacter sp.]|nr:MAG: hypothetical protein EOO61_04320 [Hymenobacter sp.]